MTAGASVAYPEEVRWLNQLGLETKLILLKPAGKYSGILRDMPYEELWSRIPEPLKIDFKIPGFSFFSFFHLSSPIFAPAFSWPYDIVISHGTYTCFTALQLKVLRRIPYIAFIWDPISYILRRVYSDAAIGYALPALQPLGRAVDSIITRQARAIILPSKFHLIRLKALTNRPIHVVYPGTYPSLSFPNKKRSTIVSVARWEEGKKPFFLLEILALLKRRGIRVPLLMVGPWRSPQLKTQFINAARRLDLLGRVRLLGERSRKELDEIYETAIALVHPITESFGLIGLEGAAHGCPPLIPEMSGVTDLLVNGEHGFFPKEGDAETFGNFLMQLLENQAFANRMSYQAWDAAKSYTWSRHAQELSRVIEEYV